MTTSWDDGSPLDFRIADLLAKYDLPATFYIPRSSQRPTMDESHIRELASRFDIGGHTLDHLALTTLSMEESRRQIGGCKHWLEDVIGRQCRAFCPPLGKFRHEHLAQIRSAGFDVIRTVELLSIDLPRHQGDLRVMPTSVQAYPHKLSSYVKNALRRRAPGNLLRAFVHVHGNSWPALCESLMTVVMQRGGVLHLWGHSWEIEEMGQWRQLEDALAILASHSDRTSRLSNSDLAGYTKQA